MTPTRSALLLVLAALIVALVWWTQDPAAPNLEVADVPEGEDAADLRSADAPPTEGPTLSAPIGVEEHPDRGPLLVRVLGVNTKPITGPYVSLRATARGGEALGKARPVDARGELRFDDVAYDGSMKLEFWRRNPYQGRGSTVWEKLPAKVGGHNEVVVHGPEVVFRARTGLAWRVEVVDAETGVALEDARVRLRKGGSTAENPWEPAPHAWTVTSQIGRNVPWTFAVEAPQHMVAWERTGVWRTISPFARGLRQVHPLRREIDVTVHPEAAEGGAVVAKVNSIMVAGARHRSLSWKRDAHGRLRIRGVPFLRGELIAIDVSREDDRGADTVTARIPEQASGRIALPIVLGDDEPFEGPANNGTIGIGGSSSSSFRPRIPPPDNHLEVRVLRRDGSPAADVDVGTRWRRARTDERGVARLRGVLTGEATVTVRAAGLLPLERTFDMPEQGTQTVVLREGEGGLIELEVVDGAGRPLSFASVDVRTSSGHPWVDLDGDIQRLDPFTDHLGRRTLRHVEPGTVALHVRWGARSKTVNVEVEPGGTTTARVELPMLGRGR